MSEDLSKAFTLIKQEEGLRLEAYPDPVSGDKPWTIGYGHTLGVFPRMRITVAQAEEYLTQDIEKESQNILKYVTVPLSNNQLCALCSFVHNVGLNAFYHSHLLTYLNKGLDKVTCAEQFLLWTHAGGKVVEDLVQRRKVEARLFLS